MHTHACIHTSIHKWLVSPWHTTCANSKYLCRYIHSYIYVYMSTKVRTCTHTHKQKHVAYQCIGKVTDTDVKNSAFPDSESFSVKLSTYIHRYLHTYIAAASTGQYINTYVHTHTCACIYTRTCMYTHTCTCTYTRNNMHICIHAYSQRP
jgi:hypothetical protein